jgi:large subunit ribosomal protein L31
MKEKIHPEYYPEAKVTCSCGNVFEVGSTQKDIKTEICSKCHPFYTGEQKIIDAQGQVQKFKEKWNKKK